MVHIDSVMKFYHKEKQKPEFVTVCIKLKIVLSEIKPASERQVLHNFTHMRNIKMLIFSWIRVEHWFKFKFFCEEIIEIQKVWESREKGGTIKVWSIDTKLQLDRHKKF